MQVDLCIQFFFLCQAIGVSVVFSFFMVKFKHQMDQGDVNMNVNVNANAGSS